MLRCQYLTLVKSECINIIRITLKKYLLTEYHQLTWIPTAILFKFLVKIFAKKLKTMFMNNMTHQKCINRPFPINVNKKVLGMIKFEF